jgi:hypothetical protein
MPAILIHCTLGRILVPGEVAVVEDSDTACNSSCWVFDVRLKKTASFEIRLLDFKHKKPRPKSLQIPNCAPLNEAACAAQIFFPSRDPLKVSVVINPNREDEVHFQVKVDAMHSLNR